MIEFSKRLKALREDKDYTQTFLAKEILVNQRSLSDYECGKYEPDLDTLVRISTFFNVSTDYLLGLTDESKPYKRKLKNF